MVAAWRVTGEPKDDKARVVDAQKLDYELFDRWLRFLERPPTYYPYLKSWQEMVKRGGTEAEAKRLAEEFQDLVVDVLIARRQIKEENDIIAAKALPTTKPREPANKPNEFKTNDDFCPGCGLELKTHADRAHESVDGRVRARSGQPGDARQAAPPKPGAAAVSAGGDSSASSARIGAR